MNANTSNQTYPPKFLELKREIASSYPNFEERVIRAWRELIGELSALRNKLQEEGTNYIPQVDFSNLENLTPEEVNLVKRRGCVVIKDIVDDKQAIAWRESLREFVHVNPVEGTPADDKQFFQLYWTKAQVQARANPDLLKATIWLNNLYHEKSGNSETVDLSVPLSYADRFRIRRPGVHWAVHPPHIDGGSIERWEDPMLRKCFEDILSGEWRSHDPYDLKWRIKARTSLYGRPNQSTVFRTFQGWLSMSETAPTQGTLRVFPDVVLSNAYIILRPFVRPLVPAGSTDILDPENWAIDLETPDFPGIWKREGKGWAGPHPTPLSHPHLFLDRTMTSVPKVNPGDAVFWHCDVIHSVEEEHTGTEDSAVMYIPAVPYTVNNFEYVQMQKECFLIGQRPPDFPQGEGEAAFVGIGTVNDINNDLGRKAMGLPIAVA